MKTELLLVGKTVDPRLASLVDEYVARIGHYMPFSVAVLPALKTRTSLSIEQQKQAEGEAILSRLAQGDTLVLFDERGKELTSLQLAAWLEHKQQTVSRRMVMAVGGPYGFSEAVYGRADERLSLSRLTLSHQMVRLFVAEQIYRACTIIRGEHYHHE